MSSRYFDAPAVLHAELFQQDAGPLELAHQAADEGVFGVLALLEHAVVGGEEVVQVAAVGQAVSLEQRGEVVLDHLLAELSLVDARQRLVRVLRRQLLRQPLEVRPCPLDLVAARLGLQAEDAEGREQRLGLLRYAGQHRLLRDRDARQLACGVRLHLLACGLLGGL